MTDYTSLKEVYDELFKRYNTKAQNAYGNKLIPKEIESKILLMGITCINKREMDITKLSRWLGFIQGMLFVYGVISIDEERDFSRPLIHKAFEQMGLEKPKTININKEIMESWE